MRVTYRPIKYTTASTTGPQVFQTLNVKFHVLCRRMRFIGCGVHRINPREITVRPGGLRADSIPRPADTLRKVAPAAAIAADRLGASHRTAVLCTTSRQNADRDTYQGHAA